MIKRFREVVPGLFRGGKPSPKDVAWMHDKLGIKKVVSLDKEAGEAIERTCKLLNIKQIIVPIDIANLKKSLLNLFKYDLKELLMDGGPTYLHCAEGKDRAGFVVALFQCKYLGKSPDDAIEEAKSLGFGLDVNPKMIEIFEKLIKACKPNTDSNNADIVDNQRGYRGDDRDSYLNEADRSSFAPYHAYKEIDDQSTTRENYGDKIDLNMDPNDSTPLVGVYNNGAGIQGAGAVISPGGFIYE